MKAVAEIVSQLIQGVQGEADVDLNAIKREAVSKYALQRTPKLVEIIAAVPEEWKANLLPRCAADGCCVMLQPAMQNMRFDTLHVRNRWVSLAAAASHSAVSSIDCALFVSRCSKASLVISKAYLAAAHSAIYLAGCVRSRCARHPALPWWQSCPSRTAARTSRRPATSASTVPAARTQTSSIAHRCDAVRTGQQPCRARVV